MGSKVRFEGIGLFLLSVAQEASATGHLNNGVTVSFMLDAGGGKHLSAVNVQITADCSAATGNRRRAPELAPRHPEAAMTDYPKPPYPEQQQEPPGLYEEDEAAP